MVNYAHPLSGVFKKVLQLFTNSSVALCKTFEALIGKDHSDRLLSICGRRKKQRTIQEHFERLNDVESTHYPEIGHWVSFVRSTPVCDFDLYGSSILNREEGSADPVLVVSCVDQSIGKGLVASGTVGVVVCIVAITDN